MKLLITNKTLPEYNRQKIMKSIYAKNRLTGEIIPILYAANSIGNMRYWVDGKFYRDKKFDKLFILVSKDHYQQKQNKTQA